MAAEVPGDPQELRALAVTLRRAAAVLSSVPHPTVDGWRAPAADRTRATVTGAARTAGRVADELTDCAARLDRAADDLALAGPAGRRCAP